MPRWVVDNKTTLELEAVVSSNESRFMVMGAETV